MEIYRAPNASTPAVGYRAAGESESNAPVLRAPQPAIPLDVPAIRGVEAALMRKLDGPGLQLKSGTNDLTQAFRAASGRLVKLALKEDSLDSAGNPANLGAGDYVAVVRCNWDVTGLPRSSEGKYMYLVPAHRLERAGDASPSAPNLLPPSDGEPRS